MSAQNNETVETQAPAVETVSGAHTHIDFSSINLNDPEAVASIDLSQVSCEACLEMYDAHFSVSESEGEGDLLSGISFEPMNFVSNLGYMGTGMLGIFIVIALVMGVTTGLNKLFSGKAKDAE